MPPSSEISSTVSSSAVRNTGWTRVASLSGAIVAALLLAGRVVPVVSPERYPDGTILLLIFAYPVSVLGAVVIGGVSLFRLVRGSRAAVGPLLTVLVAAAILGLPLEPVLREVDDRLHRTAREEIVRRLETGELAPPQWYSAPPGRWVEAPQRGNLLISVPREFSAAVSNAGGQNMLQTTFDPSFTRAVFQPHPGIGNRLWAVVYDRNDHAPDPGDLSVVPWRFQRVERLREHWFRVIAE